MANDCGKPTDDYCTHLHVDLDACLSVYIHARFIYHDERDGITVCFVPAGQCQIYTIACDTGLGKFDHHQFGRNESPCAAKLVWQQLPEGEDKEALQDLVEYVNRQDLYGSCYPQGICLKTENNSQIEITDIPQDLRTIGNLNAIIAGMHEMGKSDIEIFDRMWETFDALVFHRRIQIRGQKSYQAAAVQVSKNVVYFVCTPDTYYSFAGCAFRDGAKAVIYSLTVPGLNGAANRYGMGLRRANDLAVDLNLLPRDGLFHENWFFHKDGWLACNGDPKFPKERRSNVSPVWLAEQFERLLSEEAH